MRNLSFNPPESVKTHCNRIENLGNHILKSFGSSGISALNSICRWVEITRKPLSALKYRLRESEEVKNFDGGIEYKYVTNTSSSRPTKRTIQDVNVWEHTGPGNRVSDMSPVEMFEKEEEGERTIDHQGQGDHSTNKLFWSSETQQVDSLEDKVRNVHREQIGCL